MRNSNQSAQSLNKLNRSKSKLRSRLISHLRSKSFKSLHLSKSKSFYSPLKSISITKSDQGDEGTCLAHACAHLVVKNVFEPLFPLKMTKKEEDIYRQHSCNEYLKTHKLVDINSIKDCSLHGYYKILLFLYVYFTAYENFIMKGKKQFLSPIVSFVLQLTYIPKIFDQTFHLPLLQHLLKTIKTKMNGVKYDTVELANPTSNPTSKSNSYETIRKILDGGFYVAINLTENQNEESKSNKSNKLNKSLPKGHTSTIVAHTPSHFIVKNSWDETLDYISYKHIAKNDVILIYSGIRWKIHNFFTVLPIFKNMELYDGYREDFTTDLEIEERELPIYKKWIFNYISKFKTLKP